MKIRTLIALTVLGVGLMTAGCSQTPSSSNVSSPHVSSSPTANSSSLGQVGTTSAQGNPGPAGSNSWMEVRVAKQLLSQLKGESYQFNGKELILVMGKPSTPESGLSGCQISSTVLDAFDFEIKDVVLQFSDSTLRCSELL